MASCPSGSCFPVPTVPVLGSGWSCFIPWRPLTAIRPLVFPFLLCHRSPAALKIHDSMSKVPGLLEDRPFTGRASWGLPGATLRLVQHHQVHPSYLPYFTWLSVTCLLGMGAPDRVWCYPVSKSLSTLRASAPALSIVLGPCRCSIKVHLKNAPASHTSPGPSSVKHLTSSPLPQN